MSRPMTAMDPPKVIPYSLGSEKAAVPTGELDGTPFASSKSAQKIAPDGQKPLAAPPLPVVPPLPVAEPPEPLFAPPWPPLFAPPEPPLFAPPCPPLEPPDPAFEPPLPPLDPPEPVVLEPPVPVPPLPVLPPVATVPPEPVFLPPLPVLLEPPLPVVFEPPVPVAFEPPVAVPDEPPVPPLGLLLEQARRARADVAVRVSERRCRRRGEAFMNVSRLEGERRNLT